MGMMVSAAIHPLVAVTLGVRHPALRGKFRFSERSSLQLACLAPILRRLSAMQTSLNSAFFNPRMLNCLNPKTLLIQPLGGSAIHFSLR
jgi:hypothetical protein